MYTAANGDRIQTSYGGPVQVTGPVSVSFSGTETIVGEAVTAPPGLPGAGRVGIDGSITN